MAAWHRWTHSLVIGLGLLLTLPSSLRAQSQVGLVFGVLLTGSRSTAAVGTRPDGAQEGVHLRESLQAPWIATGGRYTRPLSSRAGLEVSVVTTGVEVSVSEDTPTTPPAFRGLGSGTITTAAAAVRLRLLPATSPVGVHLLIGPALTLRLGGGYAGYSGKASPGMMAGIGANGRLGSWHVRADIGATAFHYHLRKTGVIEPDPKWRADVLASVGIVIFTL